MIREALMALEHAKLILRAAKRTGSLKSGVVDHVAQRLGIREGIRAWRKAEKGRWANLWSDGIALGLDGVELPLAVLLCPKCVDMVALCREDFAQALTNKRSPFFDKVSAITQYWALRFSHDGCITVEGNVILDIAEQVRRGRERQRPCAVCERIGKEKRALCKLRLALALLGHEMTESVVTMTPPAWEVSTKDGKLFYLPFADGADPYDDALIDDMCEVLSGGVSRRQPDLAKNN